ncbi:GNAT family N-acetyltransferase [Lapidilactobacillus wuchangensis]|uniref:GNAT family N-acetyltransferase n=1 Tax=Lapidilactobacillus wuchangensis TaxID=2486001 RepID=UPI000F781B52|nr:GNAT family N-acetyltransferase [Lapidilactobacillus wuchangensis]
MITIREATPQDAATLVKLMRLYYDDSPVPHQFAAADMQAHLTRLSQVNSVGSLMVAVQADQIVGFALNYFGFDTRALQKTLTLNDLFVLKSARRQGIARQLITATFDWAQVHHCVSVDWVTRTSNVGAQQLYDQLADRETGWYHYQHQL